MSRKRTTDMSTTETLEPDEQTYVVVDYRGTMGAAPGQARVSHVRMPYIFEWPETGVEELILYPGCNVIEAEKWALYKGKVSTIANMCTGKARQLREIESLEDYDDHDLLDEEKGLIARTVSHAGLDWIRAQAADRKLVVDAVEARRPYARELPIQPEQYAEYNYQHQNMGKQGAKPIHPTVSMV